jgi:hypothetical protein
MILGLKDCKMTYELLKQGHNDALLKGELQGWVLIAVIAHHLQNFHLQI